MHHAFAGRPGLQPLYRFLRNMGLAGMGFDVAHFKDSGELEVLRAIAAQGTKLAVIIDVGAHIGEWSQAAHVFFPEASIYAFEPATANYARLEETVKDLPVTCVKAALSDTVGIATLHTYSSQPWLASLYMLDLEHRSYGGFTESEPEDVSCTTVDAYCAEAGIERVDFLKIDAEGHDFAVLRGASGLLEKGSVSYVQFEIGDGNLDSRTFLRDFIKLLGPRYEIFRVMSHGLAPLHYSAREEIFMLANYLARRRN